MPAIIRPVEILLIEDNPGDVNLTRIALAEKRNSPGNFREINVNLSVVADGVEAMDFLHRHGKYHQAVHPDLILLDWNLPRKDGREVLLEIKADDQLQRIPTIVLTTSQAEEDIIKAYNLHANCYITKPLEFDRFLQIIRSIEDFWFNIVQLPPTDQ